MPRIVFSDLDKEKEEQDDASPDILRNRFLTPQVIAGLKKLLPNEEWKELKTIPLGDDKEHAHAIWARRTDKEFKIGFWTDGKTPEKAKPDSEITALLKKTDIGKQLKAWLYIPSFEYAAGAEEEESANFGDAPTVANLSDDDDRIKIRNINKAPNQQWFTHVNKAWFPSSTNAQDDKQDDKKYWPEFVNDGEVRWSLPDFPREIPININTGEDSKPVVALAKCSIPDDHIDPRRWALFVARSILTEMRDGGRTC
jgi:hypothetical protein